MQQMLNSGLAPLQVWTPRPYQTEGSNFLLTQRYGGLILWPGFGKTTIVLHAINRLKKAGYKGRFLILAPLKVAKYTWPAEQRKWVNFEDLTVHVLHGKGRTTDVEADIYVTNFETLKWLLEPGMNRLKELGITALVIDELSKFKHHSSARFKMLKPFLPQFHYRWGLTGSLMTRHYVDLFGLMYVLDCGAALGKFVTHFRKKYFDYDSYARSYTPYEGAVARITKAIAPRLFTLPERDYIKLPALVEVDYRYEMSPQVWQTYRTAHNDFVVELESGDIEITSASAKLNKCQQIVSGNVYDEFHTAHYVHDERYEALDTLLDELDGEQVMIVYWYEFEWVQLKARYGDRIGFINSQTHERDEQATINAWNAGKLELLGLQPASGGHGLNLQESSAKYVVWFGLTNDYDYYDQALRRVLRSGNDADKVLVYRLVASNTVDEALIKLLAKKGERQSNLVADLAALVHRV